MEGDVTLFMRADQVEAAWSVVMPILEMWQATPRPTSPIIRPEAGARSRLIF